MDSNEAKVRIAEMAVSLTKLQMEQRPADFKVISSVNDAFTKHYDTIFQRVAAKRGAKED